MSPLKSFLLTQTLAAGIAASLIHVVWPNLFATPILACLVQGVCAAYLSYKLEAPRWWLPIHLAFLPLAALIYQININPTWYLAAFVALLLVFWRTDKSQVPLYLSNAETAAAVIELLPPTPCHVIDLGCGHAGLLRQLAKARPDCEFLGIEHAPATFCWAWLASLRVPNLRIRRGDFWQQHLGLFEVVYAFLSPVPMRQLWQKACSEMRPGGLLISNSFAVPEIEPEKLVEIADRRLTQLFCYRPTTSESR